MDSEKVIKRDNEYVLHTYARNPIVLEKGHGLYAEGPPEGFSSLRVLPPRNERERQNPKKTRKSGL